MSEKKPSSGDWFIDLLRRPDFKEVTEKLAEESEKETLENNKKMKEIFDALVKRK